jgi:WD40 repeat protein
MDNLIIKRRNDLLNYLVTYFPNDLSKIISSYDYYLEGKSLDFKCKWMNCIAVFPDSLGKIVGACENKLIIWNAKNGNFENTLVENYERNQYAGKDIIRCVAILPDESIVYGTANILKIWKTKTNMYDNIHEDRFEGHRNLITGGIGLGLGSENYVSCVIALPDKRIASGSHDGEIKIWNSNTRECEISLQDNHYVISCLATLSDTSSYQHNDKHKRKCERIVSGSYSGKIKVWNLQTEVCEIIFSHNSPIYCIAVENHIHYGERIISGSYDCSLKIWNVQTRNCDETLEGHSRPINCVDILPDGRIVSGSCDNTIKIWNRVTGTSSRRARPGGEQSNPKGKCELTFTGHTRPIYCLNVLPDGRIISGSSDDTMKVWC